MKENKSLLTINQVFNGPLLYTLHGLSTKEKPKRNGTRPLSSKCWRSGWGLASHFFATSITLSGRNPTAKQTNRRAKTVFYGHRRSRGRVQGIFRKVDRKVCLRRRHLSHIKILEKHFQRRGHSKCTGLRWEYFWCVWRAEETRGAGAEQASEKGKWPERRL